MRPHKSPWPHTPANKEEIVVKWIDKFDPPFVSLNLFDVQERLEATSMYFNFSSTSTYTEHEAQIAGYRQALDDALAVFWSVATPDAFHEVCTHLLKAEGIEVSPRAEGKAELAEEETVLALEEVSPEVRPYDAVDFLVVPEPGGYRRVERWAFDFTTYHSQRLSSAALHDEEARITSVILWVRVSLQFVGSSLQAVPYQGIS